MSARVPQGERIYRWVAAAAGAVVGLTYFLLKLWGFAGGLGLLAVSSLLAGLLFTLPVWRTVHRHFFSWQLLLRGALFALTQLLICESIRQGSVGASVNSSILGTIVGLVAGRLYLGERATGAQTLGIGIGIAGALLSSAGSSYTWGALAAGLLLGLNGTLMRSLFRDGRSLVSIVGVPLIHAAVLMLAYEIAVRGMTFTGSLSLGSVGVFVMCLVLVQGLTALVSKHLDSQRAAAFSLTRLPTVTFLESMVLGMAHSPANVSGMLLILLGAAWVFVSDLRLRTLLT